jgi:predicted ester cyclase
MNATPFPQHAQHARERFLAFRKRLYVEHDLAAVDEYLHPSFASENPMVGGTGIAAYKTFIERFYTGVPDLRPVEQHVLVEGDELMAMTTWSATHTGTFLGATPTHKVLRFATADRYALRDGLLFRHWDVVDRLQASIDMGLLRPASSPV